MPEDIADPSTIWHTNISANRVRCTRLRDLPDGERTYSMAEYSECLLEPLREVFDFTSRRVRERGAFVSFLNSRACILLVLSLALLQTCAWSQTQLATLSGTVTDPSGAVVPGVSVMIVSQGAGLKRSVLTDTAGEYRFAGMPRGIYSLHVEKPGFQSQIRDGVALVPASGLIVNFSLTIGDLREQVTVNANLSGIDSTTSTVSGLVAEPSLTKLPLNNQDLFSAVALEPGVAPDPGSAPSLLSSGKTAQVSINGVRPSMTNVLIDGIDATDPVFGYSPAGASGFFLGLDELSQVSVLTQTFNAEYGGQGGAVIEMKTRSGNNQFHGSLWELHRDASLDSKNYFDLGANPIP